VASLGSAIFPMIVSSIYGATGNYVYSWAAVLVLSLLALVLINITYVAKKNYISNKSTN
jgi:MFS-type transporter involved in bile tolerance (Atg22 family)